MSIDTHTNTILSEPQVPLHTLSTVSYTVTPPLLMVEPAVLNVTSVESAFRYQRIKFTANECVVVVCDLPIPCFAAF
jgi:hypothetical protein